MLQQQRNFAYGGGGPFPHPQQRPLKPPKGTPIVKNGKLVGYAIPLPDASLLPPPPPPGMFRGVGVRPPGMVPPLGMAPPGMIPLGMIPQGMGTPPGMVPLGMAPGMVPPPGMLPSTPLPRTLPDQEFPKIDDSEFPDLEDYSILEPEITLDEKPGVLLISEKPLQQTAPRKVMVNGKLLTLVPYSQMNKTNRPQQPEILKMCDMCGVKLPENLIGMHMQMRHKDLMKPVSKPVIINSRKPPQEKQQPQKPPKENISEDDEEDLSSLLEPEVIMNDEGDSQEETENENQDDDNLVELNPADGTLNASENKSSTPTPKTDGPYFCRFCEDGFDKPNNLRNHVLNHFKPQIYPELPAEKPFICPECKAVSRDKVTLLRHYAWSHRKVYEMAAEEDFKTREKDDPIREVPTKENPSPGAPGLSRHPVKISLKSKNDKEKEFVKPLPPLVEMNPSTDDETVEMNPSNDTEKVEMNPSTDDNDETVDMNTSNDNEKVERNPSTDDEDEKFDTNPSADSEMVELNPLNDAEMADPLAV